MLAQDRQLFKKQEWLGVIFLERIPRDLTAQSQAEETPPSSGISVLTQVNKPWFSWICVVWLNQRSKGNSKNLLGLPGRRTSPSDLSQLKQNKEIIVHCGNYSEIFEQKKWTNYFSAWTSWSTGSCNSKRWWETTLVFWKEIGNSLQD